MARGNLQQRYKHKAENPSSSASESRFNQRDTLLLVSFEKYSRFTDVPRKRSLNGATLQQYGGTVTQMCSYRAGVHAASVIPKAWMQRKPDIS